MRGDYGATGVWNGSQMLIAERVSVSHAPYCVDVAAAFDPSGGTWHRLPPAPGPQGCFEGGDQAVWDGTEMLLWGVTNTAFDPAKNTWRHLPAPPAGGGGPSIVVWTGRRMIGWGGGCCGGAVADGAIYTPATDSWKLLPAAPISARTAVAGAWTGTEMLVAGGIGPESDPPQVFADGAAYDPAAKSWRKLPAMPEARFGATSVWDGTELLVVGGRTMLAGRMVAAVRGLAFDPQTNHWRQLPAMTYPRDGAAAVWTGSAMLVWGGATGAFNHPGIPPRGEMYDPATNSWTLLPKSPLGHRFNPFAVWADREMIVWGGAPFDSDGPAFADGAAFTPGTG